MTIQINILQVCNGCGTSRALDGKTLEKIHQAAELGGWRCVKEILHLCAKCIDKALD